VCMPTTAIIGATTNPSRYAYRAALQLVAHGEQILPVGIKTGSVAGVAIRRVLPDASDSVETVTMYVSPGLQPEYYKAIIALRPARVIFNPGTENPAFAEMLRTVGIVPVEACTLVLLATGQYHVVGHRL
jgi:uncharacterized protein